ncbi:MAG: ROK family protein [Candidatus Omnitrophica bacterium]|nr:ROK family protein [Candidatus Omnitrophota bacterium]
MSNKFIIAIDLGGTNLKIALLNSRYKIIAKELLSTKKFTKSTLIQAIIKSVNKILEEHGIARKSLLGVGLGVPGPINFKKGIIYFMPNISGWHNVPLRAILRKRLALAVFLDNDANLMSLAEYRLGAAKGAENAVCLTLGTGVGGGVIINRQLYRGSGSVAGEIGHIPVNLTGPRCNCGGRACLEAYIGNSKIEKVAERIFKEKINLAQLSALARKNNRKAIKVWDEVGSILGSALVGVINLLNPDCIVIGGGVAGAGRVLFNKIREIIRGQAMPIHRRAVKVHRAKLGADAGLIGAALLVDENAG